MPCSALLSTSWAAATAPLVPPAPTPRVSRLSGRRLRPTAQSLRLRLRRRPPRRRRPRHPAHQVPLLRLPLRHLLPRVLARQWQLRWEALWVLVCLRLD